MRHRDIIKIEILDKHEEVKRIEMAIEGLRIISGQIDQDPEAPQYAKDLATAYLEDMQDRQSRVKDELVSLLRDL